MKQAILLAACLLAFVASAEAQQHAPAGGTYVNGKFYAGGQFLPNSAGGFGMAGGGGGGDGFYFAPMPPARPYRPLTTARRLARVQARTSARTTASSGRTNTTINLPSFSTDASRPTKARGTPLPTFGLGGGGADNTSKRPLDVSDKEPQSDTEPQSDAVKLAEGRLQMAKNLIAINKDAQAKEYLDLVVKMNASQKTVKEAKDLIDLIASIAK